MRLTRENFDRARNYVMENGRPLEQSLFRYVFEDGTRADVLQALAQHQAPTGGFFGMGEGPSDTPSPIGSTVAFQHLTDINASSDDAIVQGGIRYFIDTYNSTHEAWPQLEGDNRYFENDLPWNWGNPGAEIVGYLWRFKDLVPEEFLAHVTDVASARLREVKGPVSPFAGLCFLRCASFIDEPHREEIIRKVANSVAHHNLERDHSTWEDSYFVKPYWHAMTPSSPLRGLLKEEIDWCLDFDIRTQESDGSARLTFHVEGPDRMIWKSVWTLESLRVHKAYNRIEGI